MLELIDRHTKLYAHITKAERLKCVGRTAGSVRHLRKNIRARLNRESAIPDQDIEQSVQQIIDYPFLGGQKGSLKLQADENALLGATVYKEIKQQLSLEAETELQKRKEQSELQKNHYKRRQDKEENFTKRVPGEKHEIWAIDFVNFWLFGIYFRICVVYEIFSQAYLAIHPAETATVEVAKEALNKAYKYAGKKPKWYLLSDNGKQFICDTFKQLLKALEVIGQQIPPGQPWNNGELESGNRDLKKVIYTIAFHEACKDIKISRKGVDRQQLLNRLEDYCINTQHVINEEIVRPKFNSTPLTVLSDKVAEGEKKRQLFIKNKQQERKERMAHIKKHGGSKRKRIEDKVTASWKKVSAQMSTDEVFAFCELVNQRYKAVAA